MKVFFKTFGCRSNIFDTQVMISSLLKHTICDDINEADVVVINSCTVTNGADKAVREYITKANRLQKKILFTGCGLDSVGKWAYDKNAVFGAFGHSSKQNIAAFIESKKRFYVTNNLKHIDNTIVERFIGKSRAFVKIQEGCNFKCNYCIIPQVRGRTRSLTREQILSQVQILADNDVSEIVLSGTNLGSYGKDTNDTLPKLLIAISKIRGIKRVRLGSLEPSQIKEDFLELLDSSFLAKHLHIAIQHTDNTMLKIMNRINRFESDLRLFEYISNKGFALGTDFIVGHPGESEEIFTNAFGNLLLLPLTHIHLFIYSIRSNTKSANMKQDVSKANAKERLNAIKCLINDKNKHFRESVRDMPLEILVEHKKGVFFYGLDQFFNRIKIKSDKNLTRSWICLQNYDVKEEGNYAEI